MKVRISIAIVHNLDKLYAAGEGLRKVFMKILAYVVLVF